MDLYMRKEKKVYAIFTAEAIVVLASTFIVILGSLQLLDVNMKALAQSSTSIIIGSTSGDNAPRTDNFKLTSGYTIEPVVWNLTLPSSITFDNENNMYIAEAGFVYGGLIPTPRILKVDNQSGTISVLVDRNLNGPITDIEFYNGKLYVSHRGIISTVELQTGLVKDIIVGLPSIGDHHNNQIAIGGPDNRIYFGQGEATNSGVVGEDNFRLGWTKTAPYFHDIPAKNITLTGQNFVTKNPLTAEPNDNATTGAFVPFGTSTYAGQVIPGDIKCTGCILSAKLDGTDLKLVGWGFRSAYGMAFSPIDRTKLLVTVNGADERGSRPISDDIEKVYLIDISNASELGKFYGWPDFFGNAQPVTDPKFQSPKGNNSQQLEFLIQNHPPVEKPLVQLDIGAALAQVDFSSFSSKKSNNTNNNNGSTNPFGFEGLAFISEFGIMVPISHSSESIKKEGGEKIVGQKVVILNLQTGNYSDFVSLNGPDIGFRPVGIAYKQDESALYIASIGKVEVRTTLPNNGTPLPNPVPWYYPNTGVIWKITKSSGNNS
jgi:glucose/arabinose dehydrogenase